MHALAAWSRFAADRALPFGVAMGLLTLSWVFEARGVAAGLGHDERSASLYLLVALHGLCRAITIELPAISFVLVLGVVLAFPKRDQRLGLLLILLLVQFSVEWVIGPWGYRTGSALSAVVSGDPARMGAYPFDVSTWSIHELVNGLQGVPPPGGVSPVTAEQVREFLWLRVGSLVFVAAPGVALWWGRRRISGGYLLMCWLASIVVTWAGSVAVILVAAPRGGSIAWVCAPALLTAIAALLAAKPAEPDPPPPMTLIGGLAGFVGAIGASLIIRAIPWQELGRAV